MAKDDKKNVAPKVVAPLSEDSFEAISTKAELKTFLLSLKEKMDDESCPSIYGLSSINYVLNLTNIYEIFDNENKEIAKEIWLKLKQAGWHINDAPMIFGAAS